MIGKLTGLVDYVAPDHALIDVGGVGYVVQCSPSTLRALPGPGERTQLYTELVVREDLMQLIGFQTVAEREWYRLLVSVQGVGAKVALAILGALGGEGVGRALALGDAGAIKAAPGVGPKLASRIVNELRDRAPDVLSVSAGQARGAAASSATLTEAPAVADALSALVNLGYDRIEAAQALSEASDAPDTPAMIKAALKRLAPAS